MANQAGQGGAGGGGGGAPVPKGYVRKKIKWQTKARNGKSRRWKSRWILVKSRAVRKKA
jgi:hypothetical protein